MSKSLGNLVFVSRLRELGVDPRAIRLAILAHHYRSDWEWSDEGLAEAAARLDRWTRGFASETDRRAEGTRSAHDVTARVREALRHDLDTPRAIGVLDEAANTGVDDPEHVLLVVDALLGVDVRRSSD
jgi:L-cysteine:1D-myo-inositol 2-amino-2-deoxy-alpha-D-glucopyranoside ligase